MSTALVCDKEFTIAAIDSILECNMENAPPRQVGGSNEEAVTGVLVHKADHQVQIVTRAQEVPENGIILHRPVCDLRDKILQNITCQGEFRKNQ